MNQNNSQMQIKQIYKNKQKYLLLKYYRLQMIACLQQAQDIKLFMQKSNTFLYHDHIINGINTLDKRKDQYINKRLSLLHQYCTPLRLQIQRIKQDIKYYQNMRDTAYQVIQSYEDIMQLKKQIIQYKSTNTFYDSKFNQYERLIAHISTHNKQKKQLIQKKKQQLKTIYNQTTINSLKSTQIFSKKQSAKDLISLTTATKASVGKGSRLIKLKTQIDQNFDKNSLQNSRLRVNTQIIDDQTIPLQQKIQLPRIYANKNIRYYMKNNQRKQFQRHYRNLDRIDKIINQSLNYKQLKNSIVNPQVNQMGQIQLNLNSIKDIKIAISQFDHIESLFHDCFQRKKLLLQKSVSQLQSRLITNKQQFLKICQALDKKKITICGQQFCYLTTDQITILFISFSWVSKKIYNQFSQKRKKLMQAQKQIKYYEQSI